MPIQWDRAYTIELVRNLRTSNALAWLKIIQQKLRDVRARTGIVNKRNRKTRENSEKKYRGYGKTQELRWVICLSQHLYQIRRVQLKNENRNAKIVRLIKWPIMLIFTENTTP